MKKIILSPIFLLTVQLIFGQNIKFGIKTGLNISNTSNYNIETYDKTFGINRYSSDNKSNYLYRPHIEFFSIFTLNEKFSFQPEVSLSFQGVKLNARETNIFSQTSYGWDESYTRIFSVTTTHKVKFETASLNIPLLMRYRISEKMDLIAGPQVNILLTGSEKRYYRLNESDKKYHESYERSKNNELNPITIGICAGTNYALTEKLFLEARYFRSFINDFKELTVPRPDSKTSVLQASIGYIF